MKRTLLTSRLHRAATRRIQPHDRVILCSYVQVDDDECEGWQAIRIFCDEKNEPKEID